MTESSPEQTTFVDGVQTTIDGVPEPAPTTETRTLAQWVGHAGTTRVISKDDQNFIVGAKVAKRDLRWEAGSRAKVDVTDVHEDVLTYLDKEEDDIKLSTVEVPLESSAEAS